MKNINTTKVIKWLSTSVWAFPIILGVFFLTLTAFKISGSSIGIYHELLYGVESKDPDLIYGHPKPIRSDEWLLTTQSNIIQSQNNFESYNDNLRSGVDLSKSSNAPIKDWVTIFRPHNWSFFILPLENAFALKWWFHIYLLIISCYFFALRIIPKKKFSILVGIAFGLSPFVLWWYLTPIALSLAYGFLILILGMRVIDQEKIPKIKSSIITNALYICGLSFLGASLGLLLYPPYSIPVMIVVFFFMLGYILQKLINHKISYIVILKRLLIFFISTILIIAIGTIFLLQHKETVSKVSSSAYPGKRISTSGELELPRVFDGFLMPLLQGDNRGLHYHNNQSEASNFILLLPFLLIPSIVFQIVEYRKKRKVDYLQLLLNIVAILFLARGFIPLGDSFYRLLLLERVPGIRMISGLGFLGIIHALILIKKIGELKITQKVLYKYAAAYSLICAFFLVSLGLNVKERFPNFVSENYLIIVLAFWFSLIIFLILSNKKNLGILLFFSFTLFSTFKIMPLYQGLDFFQDSNIIKKIQNISSDNDSWVTTDDLLYFRLPAVAGEKIVNGSQTYPDNHYWQRIDKDKKYEYIYNRQARVVFVTDDKKMPPFKLIQGNYFQVKFSCSRFIYEEADFILGVKPIDRKCVDLIDRVKYPKKTFYIYKINKPLKYQ